MKAAGILSGLALTVCAVTSYGQPIEPEVPGDNFSLEGALELFKKSESPEEFERLLNSPDSKVNNLDLNGDGYIDYIRVFDRNERNVHAFILQAVISDNESQDVAVIELEKLANGKAVLQIIGDEDIYGVETIIEPTREVRTYAGTQTSTTVVNVWSWPSVQYIYGPYYSAWYSPWGWHTYPVWYRTWRPMTYVHYYPIYTSYRPYYTYCHTRRIHHAHHIYRPYRSTSIVVINRHRDQITRYRSSGSHGHRYEHARNDRGHSYNSRSDRSHDRDDRSETRQSDNSGDRPQNSDRYQRDDRYNNRSSHREELKSNFNSTKSDSQPEKRELKRGSTFDNKTTQRSDYTSPSGTTTPRETYQRNQELSDMKRQTPTYKRENSGSKSSSPGQGDIRRENPVQRQSTPNVQKQSTQPRSYSAPTRDVQRSAQPRQINPSKSVERKSSPAPSGGRDRLQRGR